MTTEEKAKAYDEALKAAFVAHKDEDRHLKATLERIFPELKESEDEKMKKEIIDYLKFFIPHYDCDLVSKSKVWIAWLEKQGEQKPANEVEPKFRNGQWVVWQGKCYKVYYNGCGYEVIDQNGLTTSLEYGTIDENAHLWDITKDAKDGDVLVSGGVICIFNKIHGEWVNCHCSLYKDKSFIIGNYDLAQIRKYGKEFYPATKEQHDTLFTKIKESRYEWDVEKKILIRTK